MSDHPKAAQIAGNPKEAEQYIADLVRENERLRTVLDALDATLQQQQYAIRLTLGKLKR